MEKERNYGVVGCWSKVESVQARKPDQDHNAKTRQERSSRLGGIVELRRSASVNIIRTYRSIRITSKASLAWHIVDDDY
jgi:hypothetical protein